MKEFSSRHSHGSGQPSAQRRHRQWSHARVVLPLVIALLFGTLSAGFLPVVSSLEPLANRLLLANPLPAPKPFAPTVPSQQAPDNPSAPQRNTASPPESTPNSTDGSSEVPAPSSPQEGGYELTPLGTAPSVSPLVAEPDVLTMLLPWDLENQIFDPSESATTPSYSTNPLVARNDSEQLISQLFYPTLRTTRGGLAEQIVLSDDFKSIRITLKKDLFWSDGTPITSRDVAFTLASLKKSGVRHPLTALSKEFTYLHSEDGRPIDLEDSEKDPFPSLAEISTPTDLSLILRFSQDATDWLEALPAVPVLPVSYWWQSAPSGWLSLENSLFSLTVTGPYCRSFENADSGQSDEQSSGETSSNQNPQLTLISTAGPGFLSPVIPTIRVYLESESLIPDRLLQTQADLAYLPSLSPVQRESLKQDGYTLHEVESQTVLYCTALTLDSQLSEETPADEPSPNAFLDPVVREGLAALFPTLEEQKNFQSGTSYTTWIEASDVASPHYPFVRPSQDQAGKDSDPSDQPVSPTLEDRIQHCWKALLSAGYDTPLMTQSFKEELLPIESGEEQTFQSFPELILHYDKDSPEATRWALAFQHNLSKAGVYLQVISKDLSAWKAHPEMDATQPEGQFLVVRDFRWNLPKREPTALLQSRALVFASKRVTDLNLKFPLVFQNALLWRFEEEK